MNSFFNLENITFAGLLGVIIAWWRVTDKLKADGAKQQRVDDRLSVLEDDKRENKEFRKFVYSSLREINSSVHNIELGVAERLTKLENSGCKPVKEKQ